MSTTTWVLIGIAIWIGGGGLFAAGLIRMAARKRPTPFDIEPDDEPAIEAAAVEDKAA